MKYSAAPSTILLVGIAVLFSSFTLFLVDTWIKYPLFIIESVAIITIYLVLSNQEIGNSFRIINRLLPGEKSVGLILDLILVASASILIILKRIPYNSGRVIPSSLGIYLYFLFIRACSFRSF